MKNLITLILIVFLILVGLVSSVRAENYQPGNWMLTSDWHQRPPYNNDCPDKGCPWPDYGNYNSKALVGCTPLATAQIFRYWSWPPPYKGETPYNYDWTNMLDQYIYDGRYSPPFHDGDYNQVTFTQINAVAKLCYQVGDLAGMLHHCGWSYQGPRDQAKALTELFSYKANHDFGHNDDWDEWSGKIKENLNNNRPVLYGWSSKVIDGQECGWHSVVIDGWKQVNNILSWHINLGGSYAENSWYTIHPNEINKHVMVREIKPRCSLGASLRGTYPRSPRFNYRYFDQDATGVEATFEAGQKLQFLPGVRVTGTGIGGIRFPSLNTDPSYLFTRGDSSKGVKITEGNISLSNGGSIKFY